MRHSPSTLLDTQPPSVSLDIGPHTPLPALPEGTRVPNYIDFTSPGFAAPNQAPNGTTQPHAATQPLVSEGLYATEIARSIQAQRRKLVGEFGRSAVLGARRDSIDRKNEIQDRNSGPSAHVPKLTSKPRSKSRAPRTDEFTYDAIAQRALELEGTANPNSPARLVLDAYYALKEQERGHFSELSRALTVQGALGRQRSALLSQSDSLELVRAYAWADQQLTKALEAKDAEVLNGAPKPYVRTGSVEVPPLIFEALRRDIATDRARAQSTDNSKIKAASDARAAITAKALAETKRIAVHEVRSHRSGGRHRR